MKQKYHKVEPIPFTKEGYEKIKQEKEDLLRERPDAVEHLKKAREMGDLSENGYYKASRQKLNSIDARLRRIEHLLKYGVVVASANSGVVDIGSTVTLDDDKQKVTYSIVGSEESNPSQGTISHHSPLGRSLLGKKVGETITFHAPAGERVYTIKKIA
jgi:transcription elongation factor GreA